MAYDVEQTDDTTQGITPVTVSFPRKIALMTATAAMVAMLAVKSASAAPACYNMAEFEAEQGLRIHSELMVIGLTCAKMPNGANLYSKYQTFTAKNKNLITMYENALIAYFDKQGGNAEAQFHTMRTGLANRISQLAIGNVVGFCNAFSPRLDAALTMDQDKIRRWAQQVWRDAPTSRPLCTRQAVR